MAKILLVGEANPYGADPYYALYPAPDGSAGHRLCRLVLGMFRKDYLELFDRVNLCPSVWRNKVAKEHATKLADGGLSGSDEEQKIVLLGSKVARAFGLDYEPFRQVGDDLLLLPHPSGLCRLWNEPGAFDRARAAVLEFAPELAGKVGRVDREVETDEAYVAPAGALETEWEDG